MKTEKVKITEIKPNPENPRIIKDEKFKKLVKSIQDFPEMLEIRPIVVNDEMVVLGGNMRLKAMKEAGLKEVHVIKASKLTPEQQKEFIIKDNVAFGEWQWEALSNEWGGVDVKKLEQWGVDFPQLNSGDDDEYTTKVTSPIYEPTGNKPELSELVNLSKYNELLDQIKKSKITDEEKKFLELAAMRHIVFDYRAIAEYYSHSEDKTREQFENSALVIIDYNKAIELGFVKLFDTLKTLSQTDE